MENENKKSKTAADDKKIERLTTEEQKKKALSDVLAKIEKDFGKGAIMKLNSEDRLVVDVIPTGCFVIDKAIGIGGLPRGRVVEIFGPESSGKTTIALHVVAEAQKMGGIAAFVDAEHALDPGYAAKLGVDLNALYVSQPDSGEQGLDIAEELVKSGSIDIIVIDSVAALTPKAEIDGDMGDTHIGLQARLMSQALRKMTAAISRTNTCLVFINQLRDKVGMAYGGGGETTPGGKALKFYASVRLDVRKGDVIKDGANVIGSRTKVKIVKNKLAAPFKLAEFDMIYGEGISICGCLLDSALEKGYISKSGSWFSYNDEKIGQGREKAIDFLKRNTEIFASLDAKIRADFEQKESAEK
ncbi:MAG: recombinase RecA [Christensenellaceae bacterium]|jgi:recombination protein RecA|nr:recombinase RecA [Christensenellaceae bacterium]